MMRNDVGSCVQLSDSSNARLLDSYVSSDASAAGL